MGKRIGKRDNNDNRREAGTKWKMTGLLLIAAALLLTGYNLWDQNRADQAAQVIVRQMEEDNSFIFRKHLERSPFSEREVPDYILNPEMEMPETEIDGQSYIGVLRFPSLELELPIMSQWSYPKLKTAPCRYNGTAYMNNLVIAGHNYKKHFGVLKILSLGDTVEFTDCDGNRFFYTVQEVEVLDASAIDAMITGDWDLTLFTCTYGGGSRYAVRCGKKSNFDENDVN